MCVANSRLGQHNMVLYAIDLVLGLAFFETDNICKDLLALE